MPVETLPNHDDIRYHLIAFDAAGRERSEEGGLHSSVVLDETQANNPTDVFLFAHGWNGDVPGAIRQYNNWLNAMVSCADDRTSVAAMPGGFRPLLVGLHWPSKAWGDEELGGASFGIETKPEDTSDANDVDLLVGRYAARLTDSPPTRRALHTIFESALEDAAPATLPPAVLEAYQVIDAETRMGQAGVGAPPGDDREPFDAEATYQASQQEEIASFGDISLGGVLAPLRVLTFWQMKRRACGFGESGAAELLGALQESAPATRFHLMGHSFGCIVASAAVARHPGQLDARRPVDTLTLVQGAMSLWSFCSSIPSHPRRRGYFHSVVAEGLVNGPILVTTSVHDRAVRAFYPLGAWARGQTDYGPGGLPVYGGIGTFGVRGPDLDIVDEELRPIDGAYDLQPHVIYNLDADDVIATSQGIMGAHSDICHPAVAHAIWQAISASQRE